MITEEIALAAINHYARTGEIQSVLVPFFRQTGRWVGDCRNWTKSTYRLASSIMHSAVLPEGRRTAVNDHGETILLTSFHWKKRRDVEIRWFEVRGSIRIRSLEAVSAPNLRIVDGYIYSCTDNKVGLPSLVSVGGDLDFQTTPNLHVPKLASVGGSLMAIGCDLPCLETVGNRLWGYWRGTLYLPKLRSVGGSFQIEGTEKVIAPALEWVCYDLNLSFITVFCANRLAEVGGALDARSASTFHAASLQSVGDNLNTEAALDFYRPDFEDLVDWDMHPDAKSRWELREAVKRAMRSQQSMGI
ncbi:MAG: hypothetical protein WCP35_22110 [Verrucomicrobiota bacterium]